MIRTEAQAAEDRRTRYIFVTCMLEAQRSAQVLLDKRDQLMKPTARRPVRGNDTKLTDALWDGYTALESEARECAKKALEYGQILHCFEGTTVLQGGAA